MLTMAVYQTAWEFKSSDPDPSVLFYATDAEILKN
jgi:hypothetical protein